MQFFGSHSTIYQSSLNLFLKHHVDGCFLSDSNEVSKVLLLDFSNSFTTEFLESTCWVENPEMDSNAQKLQHEKQGTEWKPFVTIEF